MSAGLQDSTSVSLEDYRLDASRPADPPLWLTVIGHDGTWPLAVLNKESATKNGPLLTADGPILDVTSKNAAEPPLISWFILFILGFLSAMSYIGVLWWAQLSNQQWCSELALTPGRDRRAFYILCVTLSLIAVWLTLASGPRILPGVEVGQHGVAPVIWDGSGNHGSWRSLALL